MCCTRSALRASPLSPTAGPGRSEHAGTALRFATVPPNAPVSPSAMLAAAGSRLPDPDPELALPAARGRSRPVGAGTRGSPLIVAARSDPRRRHGAPQRPGLHAAPRPRLPARPARSSPQDAARGGRADPSARSSAGSGAAPTSAGSIRPAAPEQLRGAAPAPPPPGRGPARSRPPPAPGAAYYRRGGARRGPAPPARRRPPARPRRGAWARGRLPARSLTRSEQRRRRRGARPMRLSSGGPGRRAGRHKAGGPGCPWPRPLALAATRRAASPAPLRLRRCLAAPGRAAQPRPPRPRPVLRAPPRRQPAPSGLGGGAVPGPARGRRREGLVRRPLSRAVGGGGQGPATRPPGRMPAARNPSARTGPPRALPHLLGTRRHTPGPAGPPSPQGGPGGAQVLRAQRGLRPRAAQGAASGGPRHRRGRSAALTEPGRASGAAQLVPRQARCRGLRGERGRNGDLRRAPLSAALFRAVPEVGEERRAASFFFPPALSGPNKP